MQNVVIFCKKNYRCNQSYMCVRKSVLSADLYHGAYIFNVFKVPQHWFQKQNRINVNLKKWESVFMKTGSICFSVSKFTSLSQVQKVSPWVQVPLLWEHCHCIKILKLQSVIHCLMRFLRHTTTYAKWQTWSGMWNIIFYIEFNFVQISCTVIVSILLRKVTTF